MKYTTIITILRENKNIVFFLNSEIFSLENIIDVEVYEKNQEKSCSVCGDKIYEFEGVNYCDGCLKTIE